MNNISFHQLAISAVALCGFAGVALGFGGDHQKHGPGKAQFEAMDADSDGKVTSAEHAAGARKMFEAMDANKDGKVGVEEMDAARPQMTGEHKKAKARAAHGMSSADKIKVIDTDADGVLTVEEHTAGARMMFERMDANKDGALSKPELRAGHMKMMGRGANAGDATGHGPGAGDDKK